MTKHITLAASVVAFLLALAAVPSAQAAEQCGNTAWKQSDGKTCRDLGLNSDRAVCRAGDTFAMWCDDTPDRIRTCASDQRCGAPEAAVTCPGAIKREYGERGCDAYLDGYGYGRKDAEDKKKGDYKRHDDRYSGGTEEPFKKGYNAAYGKYK